MDQDKDYTSQEMHETIDRYLRGEIQGDERLKFEVEVKQNVELAREVERLRLAEKAIVLYADARLRQRLKEKGETLLQEKANDKPVRKIWSNWRIWLRVAAVLVPVMILVGVKWYSDVNYDPSVLVHRYYQAKKTPAFLSGDYNHPLQEGFRAYRQKNYDRAIEFFSQVPTEGPGFPTAQLFLAYSYFESGRYQAAAQHFENVIKTGDTRYKENAEWDRLLALLAMQNEREQVQLHLDEIRSNPEHSFHQQALALNRQLNSIFKKIADIGNR
jgi:cytochrome c-type biogenesis protein CcmH/NrfG